MEICELGNSWVKKENENKRKEKKRPKDVILKISKEISSYVFRSKRNRKWKLVNWKDLVSKIESKGSCLLKRRMRRRRRGKRHRYRYSFLHGKMFVRFNTQPMREPYLGEINF